MQSASEMNAQELMDTAMALAAGDKGLLAMDHRAKCNRAARRGEYSAKIKKTGA